MLLLIAAATLFTLAAAQRDLSAGLVRLLPGLLLGLFFLLIFSESLRAQGNQRAHRAEAERRAAVNPYRSYRDPRPWYDRWLFEAPLDAFLSHGLWVFVVGVAMVTGALLTDSLGPGRLFLVLTGALLVVLTLVNVDQKLSTTMSGQAHGGALVAVLIAVPAIVVWATVGGGLRLIGFVGLVAAAVVLKVALLPLIDAALPPPGCPPTETHLRPHRNRRALNALIIGVGSTLVGAFIMQGGANGQRSGLLVIGLFLAVAGLTVAGSAGVRLVTQAQIRMLGRILVAVGLVVIGWGAMQGLDAIGDWFLLVLSLLAVVGGFGAWLVFRGEVQVALFLLAFMFTWAFLDRDAQPSSVEAAAPGAENVVLAIGDSFMSGEGAQSFENGTNTPGSNQCRRTDTAYSALVTRELDAVARREHRRNTGTEAAPGSMFAHVSLACSGAKSTNVVRFTGSEPQFPESPAEVFGGRTQLDHVIQPVPDDAELDDETVALLTKHGDLMERVKVTLVSIGGNDTGFSPLIKACLLPADCSENEDLWTAKAESLEERLTATYREIKNATPADSVVLVVPYPDFISPVGCDRLASEAEFQFVDRFIGVLNNTIARAAREAGVLVADTSGAFEGKTQCDDERGAHLVVLEPTDGGPISRLNPSNWVHGTMHPSETGHADQADVLWPLVDTLLGCEGAGCLHECQRTVEQPGVEPTDGLKNPRLIDNLAGRSLIDLCDPDSFAAVTADDEIEDLAAQADALLLEDGRWLNGQLFAAAAAIIWPMLALVIGGAIFALGLVRLEGPLASFLTPAIPEEQSRASDVVQGIHAVGMASTATSATVLLVTAARGDFDSDAEPERPGAHVVALHAVDGDATAAAPGAVAIGEDEWELFPGGWHRFWWAKATVHDLASGTTYEVFAAADPAEIGPVRATVTTSPGSTDSSLSVVVGSCYHHDAAAAENLAHRYEALTEGHATGPLVHCWLGDQIYLDSSTITDEGHELVAARYLHNWGISARPHHRRVGAADNSDGRFGDVLRRSSNHFLPDDREFWNGYPRVGYLDNTWHAVKRSASFVRSMLTDAFTVPDPDRRTGAELSPGESVPWRQGDIGRAAGLGYLVFQSTRRPKQAKANTNGAPSWEVDAGDQSPWHPPARTTIDFGGASSARLMMVDTRWYRTIQARLAQPGFMREPELADVCATIATTEGLLVLTLSRPLGYAVRRRSWLREATTETYKDQYQQLLAAVETRARNGAPTVLVGGDIHKSQLATTLGGTTVWVVSSPLASSTPVPPTRPQVNGWRDLTRRAAWVSGLRWIRHRTWQPVHRQLPRRLDEALPTTFGGRQGYTDAERAHYAIEPIDHTALGGDNPHNLDAESVLTRLDIATGADAGPHTYALAYRVATTDKPGGSTEVRFVWDGSTWRLADADAGLDEDVDEPEDEPDITSEHGEA
ncbi:MAG: SGNH/GDSL hydrolase family protein [Actinomycetota bacterium]